jgi:hypothetical protein
LAKDIAGGGIPGGRRPAIGGGIFSIPLTGNGSCPRFSLKSPKGGGGTSGLIWNPEPGGARGGGKRPAMAAGMGGGRTPGGFGPILPALKAAVVASIRFCA